MRLREGSQLSVPGARPPQRHRPDAETQCPVMCDASASLVSRRSRLARARAGPIARQSVGPSSSSCCSAAPSATRPAGQRLNLRVHLGVLRVTVGQRSPTILHPFSVRFVAVRHTYLGLRSDRHAHPSRCGIPGLYGCSRVGSLRQVTGDPARVHPGRPNSRPRCHRSDREPALKRLHLSAQIFEVCFQLHPTSARDQGL